LEGKNARCQNTGKRPLCVKIKNKTVALVIIYHQRAGEKKTLIAHKGELLD
jgi:hypothetical protein